MTNIDNVVKEFNSFLENELNPLLPEGEELIPANVEDTVFNDNNTYDLHFGPINTDEVIKGGYRSFSYQFNDALITYIDETPTIGSVILRGWVPDRYK